MNLDASQTPVLIGIVALVVFGLTERLLHVLGLRQSKAREREGPTFYLCVLSWQGTVMFSLIDAVALHWTTIAPGLSSVSYAGVPLVVAGIAVRIVSRLTLGKHFSGHVQTTEGHKLVTSGIYGWIRHPAYTGYLCLLIGFPLCFGSIGGFGCATALGVPAIMYRIRIEEAALEQWFGEEYERYTRRTRRLIPFVW